MVYLGSHFPWFNKFTRFPLLYKTDNHINRLCYSNYPPNQGQEALRKKFEDSVSKFLSRAFTQ